VVVDDPLKSLSSSGVVRTQEEARTAGNTSVLPFVITLYSPGLTSFVFFFVLGRLRYFWSGRAVLIQCDGLFFTTFYPFPVIISTALPLPPPFFVNQLFFPMYKCLFVQKTALPSLVSIPPTDSPSLPLVPLPSFLGTDSQAPAGCFLLLSATVASTLPCRPPFPTHSWKQRSQVCSTRWMVVIFAFFFYLAGFPFSPSPSPILPPVPFCIQAPLV